VSNENKTSNVVLFGADGQLGKELQGTTPDQTNLSSFTRERIDITDQQAVEETIESIKPDWVINVAAYTAVDKAEEERDEAFAVNYTGAENIARAAKLANARLVHLSTDFVFDGNRSSPYQPSDKTSPLGVYGASKQAGDEAVIQTLPDDSVIIRTAWLYSKHGHNFVKSMLRLMAEREELGVVTDQIGTPTSARVLARVIWQVIQQNLFGIYHWTDAGVASWYDFAVAIQEEAIAAGVLNSHPVCTIKPIRTSDYPTPAERPSYSVLDKTATWQALNTSPVHWRTALKEVLGELRDDKN